MNWYLEVLKKYAVFNGRARRKEYWMFFLIHILISIVIGVISGLIDIPILATIYSLAVLIPNISAMVRRLHDVNKEWWYIFIPIYSFILLCQEGDRGTNNYGPDPKNTFNEIDEIGAGA